MDYESKYKNALEWARGIYPNAVGADKEDLEHYFPELKESEGEDKITEDEHWQEVRERAAIAAMQGLLANSSKVGKIVDYTISAVDYADALIEQLKKENKL